MQDLLTMVHKLNYHTNDFKGKFLFEKEKNNGLIDS
jgi:hypothetical protein